MLIKETTYTVLAQVLALVFGIGTSILLNRILGPTGKGEFVVLLLVPQLIVAFTHLGMGTSASYFIGKKNYKDGEIINTTLLFTLIAGGGGILISHFIFNSLHLNHSYKLFILPLVIFGLWFNYTSDFFLGKGRIGLYNNWNLSQHIGKLLLLVPFLIWFTNKLQGAIIAVFSVNIMLFLVSFVILYNLVGTWHAVSLPYLKQGIGFGYKVFLLEALGFLRYRVDIFLLKIFTENTQIGYYSTATYMAEILWLVPRALCFVLYSKIVTRAESMKLTPHFIRLSLWTVIGLGILSIFIVKPIILLFYGQRFLPSLTPYLILLPGVIALAIPLVLGAEIIGGWGKPELLLPVKILAVCLNIGLNLALIPRWGMNGAAFASTGSYTIEALIYVIIYLKKTSKNVKDILIFRPTDFRALWKE